MFTDSIFTLLDRFHLKNNKKVEIENPNQHKQHSRWGKLLQITTIVFSAQFSQFAWADLLKANLLNIDPKTVNAEAWMIYDPQSQQIIAQHNADVPRAPASLTKMMVAYLTLKAIENGQRHSVLLDTIGNDLISMNDFDGAIYYTTFREVS